MRKRNSVWPIRVFKYPIKPIGEIPQQLWDIAKEMQRGWNILATEWHVLYNEFRPVIGHDTEGKEIRDKSSYTADQKARWKALSDTAEQRLAECNLHVISRREVVDRFRATCSRINKGGGPPKIHKRLLNIAIPHQVLRETQDKFFNRKSVSVSVKSIDPALYITDSREYRKQRISTGTYGLAVPESKTVGGQVKCSWVSLPFRVTLHRQIPASALIKKTMLLGEYDIFGWHWSLAITAEIPPTATTHIASAETCAIDLGWRLQGDSLRIGMIYDCNGRAVELTLPLAIAGKDVTRYNQFLRSIGLSDTDLRYHEIPSTFKKLNELSRLIAYEVDNIKTALKLSKPAELPAEIGDIMRGLVKMRQGGLIKLQRELSKANEASPIVIWPEAVEQLTKWRATHDSLARRFAAAWNRASERRQWLYYQLAHWICRTYSTVVLNGDISIKELAEQDLQPEDYSLKSSMKYRQYAALGAFKLTLKQVGAKYNTTFVNVSEKNINTVCAICGYGIEKTDKPTSYCDRGHRIDTDANTAARLLSFADRPYVAPAPKDLAVESIESLVIKERKPIVGSR